MATDILLFLVGIVVGAVNAIAGGGMLLGFPVLLATGLSPLVANATSYIVAQPGNIAAAFAYRKYLRKVPKQYLLLIIPTVIGGFAGSYILRHTDASDFARYVPWLVLFAVTLFAYQPFLYKYIHDHIHAPKKRRRQGSPILFIALAMLPLSIYGGYFGAGFGFIMLSFLGFTKLHDHIHRMNALKYVCIFFLTSSALVGLLGSGLINWHHGLIMAAGNLIGGFTAAIWSLKVPSQHLRTSIIVVGFIAAAYLALRTY
ncbi:sulfite exporter TauE/SafE family protein [Candidatus Saccharibacteria bacterium]|nr:sulfite exporter TauE/SafE family protein [Candidatus Saccharibacteria bacterium]